MQLNVFGHHTIFYTNFFCDINASMICIRPSHGFTRPKQGFFMMQKARNLPVHGDASLKKPILLLTTNEKYSNNLRYYNIEREEIEPFIPSKCSFCAILQFYYVFSTF